MFLLSVFQPLTIDRNLYWRCLELSEFVVVDGHTSYLVLVPQDNVVAEQDIVLAQITNAASDQVNGNTDGLWQSVYCVYVVTDVYYSA